MTRHVLDQLPLWVEGDLTQAEYATVETHLAQCSTCQAAAEQLRASQSLLRESLASPFDAADQDRLRRRVMDQIRTETASKPVRRLSVRPALLAASAAALLITALTWRRERAVTPPPPSLVPSTALPQPLPTQADPVRTPSAQRPAHTAREAPPLPHEEPARLEIQTSNPNVRIIWMAQAKSPSDTNPFPQEAP